MKRCASSTVGCGSGEQSDQTTASRMHSEKGAERERNVRSTTRPSKRRMWTPGECVLEPGECVGIGRQGQGDVTELRAGSAAKCRVLACQTPTSVAPMSTR